MTVPKLTTSITVPLVAPARNSSVLLPVPPSTLPSISAVGSRISLSSKAPNWMAVPPLPLTTSPLITVPAAPTIKMPRLPEISAYRLTVTLPPASSTTPEPPAPAIVPKLATVPRVLAISTPSAFPEISPPDEPLSPLVTLPPANSKTPYLLDAAIVPKLATLPPLNRRTPSSYPEISPLDEPLWPLVTLPPAPR